MCEQRVTSVLHPVSSEQISSALEVCNSGEARVSEDNKVSYCSTRRSTVLRYIPITLVVSATLTPSGIPPCHCSELTRRSVGMRTKSMICLRRVRQSEQRRDWRDTRWIPVGSDLQRPDSTCSVTTQECLGITLMRSLRSLSISFSSSAYYCITGNLARQDILNEDYTRCNHKAPHGSTRDLAMFPIGKINGD